MRSPARLENHARVIKVTGLHGHQRFASGATGLMVHSVPADAGGMTACAGVTDWLAVVSGQTIFHCFTAIGPVSPWSASGHRILHCSSHELTPEVMD